MADQEYSSAISVSLWCSLPGSFCSWKACNASFWMRRILLSHGCKTAPVVFCLNYKQNCVTTSCAIWLSWGTACWRGWARCTGSSRWNCSFGNVPWAACHLIPPCAFQRHCGLWHSVLCTQRRKHPLPSGHGVLHWLPTTQPPCWYWSLAAPVNSQSLLIKSAWNLTRRALCLQEWAWRLRSHRVTCSFSHAVLWCPGGEAALQRDPRLPSTSRSTISIPVRGTQHSWVAGLQFHF